MTAMILHLLRRNEWAWALRQGSCRPQSLDDEGFIHCSTIDQAADTANLLFRGASDLLLLGIDERRLVATLKFETPATAGDARPNTRFPHIYGALNLDAVVDAIEFPCDADGSFQLPARIREFGIGRVSRGDS
jgi:uncharacterized protein (DUF952 family)